MASFHHPQLHLCFSFSLCTSGLCCTAKGCSSPAALRCLSAALVVGSLPSLNADRPNRALICRINCCEPEKQRWRAVAAVMLLVLESRGAALAEMGRLGAQGATSPQWGSGHAEAAGAVLSCRMLCLLPSGERCASGGLSSEGAEALCAPAGVCLWFRSSFNPVHAGEGAGTAFSCGTVHGVVQQSCPCSGFLQTGFGVGSEVSMAHGSRITASLPLEVV